MDSGSQSATYIVLSFYNSIYLLKFWKLFLIIYLIIIGVLFLSKLKKTILLGWVRGDKRGVILGNMGIGATIHI